MLILLQIYTIKQHSFNLNVFLQRLHVFGLHFMHLLLMGVTEIAYIYIYSFGRCFYPQWHATEEWFIKSFHPSGTVTLEVWQSKPWFIFVRVESSPSWQHCLLIDSQKTNGWDGTTTIYWRQQEQQMSALTRDCVRELKDKRKFFTIIIMICDWL